MNKKIILYVVIVLVLCLILAAIAYHYEADLQKVAILAAGAFLFIIGRFGWLVAQKGWGWGLAKIHAWASAGKADLADLQGGVMSLQSGVAGLEGRVKALEGKLGVAPPPAPAPAAVPSAAAPVQQSPNSNG